MPINVPASALSSSTSACTPSIVMRPICSLSIVAEAARVDPSLAVPALAAEGHRVRVYIPFGREWFPYFMRRLAERPANVAFVVKSLLRER